MLNASLLKKIVMNDTFCPHTDTYIRTLEDLCRQKEISSVPNFIDAIRRLSWSQKNKVGYCEISEQGQFIIKPIETLLNEPSIHCEYRVFELLLWALFVLFFNEYEEVSVCITPPSQDGGMDIVILEKEEKGGWRLLMSIDGKTGKFANSMSSFTSIMTIIQKLPLSEHYRHLYVARDIDDFGSQMRKQGILSAISLHHLVKNIVRAYADENYRTSFEQKIALMISILKM